MTYIVSGKSLNSTHSLTVPILVDNNVLKFIFYWISVKIVTNLYWKCV